MEKLNKTNYKAIFILLCIVFIIPSIVYILSARKIINLISSFTFFFTEPTEDITIAKVIGTIFFIGIFLGLSFLYYKILKNNKKEFSNSKKVASFVLIVSIIFFIMLPLTSTDVFYYIGTGWSEAHYNINPYYDTVDELIQKNYEAKNDEILLKMQGAWSGQTVVYGPVWPLICKILSTLSMGNLGLRFIYI